MKALIVLLTTLLTMSISSEDIRHNHEADTNQLSGPLFTFGIISDVQYCDCDSAGSRYYQKSLSKLREAVGAFRSDSVDFIINLGDLIDRDYKSYDPVIKILDESGIKIFHTTGNHDYSVAPRLKRKIPQLLTEKAGFYSFSMGKFRFIFLNGNEVSTYATNSKKLILEARNLIDDLMARGEPNGVEWNGGISENQIQWLDAQITDAKEYGQKVLIFCHFPVFPPDVHNLLNYNGVLTILQKHNNVITWFSGHNHAGNYGNLNMTHFVTMRGMVETSDRNSYAEVEVYSNKVWIKGSGREKSQILAY